MNRARIIAGLALTLLTCAPIQPATAAQASCSQPFELPAAVSGARLIILGEMHGTQETPLFAAELACTLAQRGGRATLALEMDHREQAALDAYLASDGGEAARRALLSTSFWSATSDGRASTGTVAMIERVRVLRKAGVQLALLPIDDWGTGAAGREPAMTERLSAALDADPSRRFVVLVGNAHAKETRGNPRDPDYASLAVRLTDHNPLTLNAVPMSGTAWFCTRTCGPHPMTAPLDAADRGAGIHPGYSPQPGYDGTVLLPKTTAAEPAVAGVSGP